MPLERIVMAWWSDSLSQVYNVRYKEGNKVMLEEYKVI